MVGAGLVAVAYADHALANSPEPDAVLKYAASRGLEYFLLDTFDKRAGRLTDWLSPERLRALVVLAQEQCVRVALAGSLRVGDFAPMAELGADILAVRGAACERGRRDGVVAAAAVAALRRTMGACRRDGC